MYWMERTILHTVDKATIIISTQSHTLSVFFPEDQPSMENARDVLPNSQSNLRVMEALDQEYQDFCNHENQIVTLLERCTKEEMAIQTALKMAEKAPAAFQPPSRHNQEREALKRLEEALMGESSGEDDNCST